MEYCLAIKNDWTTNSCKQQGESQQHDTKWKEPDTRVPPTFVHLHEFLEQAKVIYS